MGEYRPNTCDYCKADTWCERRKNGRWQCRGCEAERFFEQVLFAPIGFRLLDWMRTSIRTIYGTMDPESGQRQYTRVLEEVAKKNGKSFKVGGMPIYHLVVEADRLDNPKAFGAAAAKDQAGIVFDSATRLIRGNPDLLKRLKILDSTKTILRRDGHGSYRVLSADGDVADGIEPSLNIIDELHRWKTAKAHTLYSVMTKGTISQPEPLTMQITTAGAEGESPIWIDEHDLATQKMRGEVEAKRLCVFIWAADEKRLEQEPEYWKSREARVAANPSHEDNGGFLKDEKIVEELDKALSSPAKKAEYLRYHLNVKVSSVHENAVDMNRWRECDGGVDLRQWPDYDVDLLIRKWGLIDRPCYAGVDASWSIDLTGLALWFPPAAEDAPWSLLSFCWAPKDRLRELERVTKRGELSKWAEQGFVIATPGNSIDTRSVMDKIRWASEMFELRNVCYDKLNFRVAASTLIDEGIPCAEVKQNYACLSEPTKKLLEMYQTGSIQHGNNPVANWHASCLALQGDGRDNVQPAKPERGKTSKRIDVISAAITGLWGALTGQEQEDAVGVRSVGA